MTTFASIAGYIAAGTYGLLLVLLLFAHRGTRIGRYLTFSVVVSIAWFLLLGIYYQNQPLSGFSIVWLQHFEQLRTFAWVLFLSCLLSLAGPDQRFRARVILGVLGVLLLGSALATQFHSVVGEWLGLAQSDLRKGSLLILLVAALTGLVTTEQVFRNTARDSRWALKHLCFGIGTLFAYDFYLYADAVLFNRLDPVIWSARGLVNALAVPMIAISASRNREWDLHIFVSRRVVFHGVVLVAAGCYLLTMAGAGYYIQMFGGEWGRALKSAFFSAAILIRARKRQ